MTVRYVLDSDLFDVSQSGVEPLAGRLRAVPPGELVLSVLTVEESLGGWYAALRQARRPDELERIYERLARAVLAFGRLPIVIYDRAVMAEYDRLKKLKLGVKSNDLRIAATALVLGATVVTRNLRDFTRVPGLAAEDWSRPAGP